MKTNPAARSVVRIRFILLCTLIVAMIALEFHFGSSFAARIGQTTGIQSAIPASPNMDFGDLMAAAR